MIRIEDWAIVFQSSDSTVYVNFSHWAPAVIDQVKIIVPQIQAETDAKDAKILELETRLAKLKDEWVKSDIALTGEIREKNLRIKDLETLLSGGMKFRELLISSLACNPSVVQVIDYDDESFRAKIMCIEVADKIISEMGLKQ